MADLCRRATRLARQDPGLVRAAGLGSGQSAAGRRRRRRSTSRRSPSTIRRPSRAASILALAALVAMIGATAAFLVAAPRLPLANGLVVFLSLAASLWAMGALLDGRISMLEALYVFAAALTCAAYSLGWPGVEDVAKPAGARAAHRWPSRRARGRADVKRLVARRRSSPRSPATCCCCRRRSSCPGLVAFLVAHGFYIAAFCARRRLSAVACRRWRRSGPSRALVFACFWPGVGAGLEGRRSWSMSAVLACDGGPGDRAGDRPARPRRGRGRGRARSCSCSPT